MTVNILMREPSRHFSQKTIHHDLELSDVELLRSIPQNSVVQQTPFWKKMCLLHLDNRKQLQNLGPIKIKRL